MLRRIQDIRTSERRFYQKITDIYSTSIDYDPTQPESIEFFQTVQNKMHWAITGQTAAEIIQKLHLQIQNLRRTRDLLLPRLLSGQVEFKTEAA